MMSVDAILALLNQQGTKKFETPPFIVKWRGVYFGMSLHTNGACPAFRLLKDGANKDNRKTTGWGGWMYPVNYFGVSYQQIFEIYLLNKHPRESEDTYQYRLSQYRPYTRIPLNQCISVVSGAIFQDSNYSITLEDKEDNDYIWGANFNGHDLINYVRTNFQWICEDPNGFFITIPKEPYYATTTPKIEPRIYFIPSKDIVTMTDDEVVFNLYDLTWVANNIGYFRFKKDDNGKYFHVDETQGGYYAHMFNRVPKIIAGGVWNTQGFYESWLVAAKAIADDFVAAKSDENLVNKESSYPYVIEASTDCPECKGVGTMSERCAVTDDTPDGFQLLRCPSCGGGGIVSRNPGQRMIVPPELMKDKLVQRIEGDVNINKFWDGHNKDLFNQMLRSLHLNYIEQAQSGVAKDKDMEARYQFISGISNDIFDRIIDGLIENILMLRNVTIQNGETVPSPTQFYITKPTQFQIKTSGELLAEFETVAKSQMPDYVRAKHIEDYIDKQFGGNEVLKRKAQIIHTMDPLAVATEAEKQARVLGGAVSKRDWQKNAMLSKMLDDIVRDKGSTWFINAKYEQISQLVEAAFALIPEVDVMPKTSTFVDAKAPYAPARNVETAAPFKLVAAASHSPPAKSC